MDLQNHINRKFLARNAKEKLMSTMYNAPKQKLSGTALLSKTESMKKVLILNFCGCTNKLQEDEGTSCGLWDTHSAGRRELSTFAARGREALTPISHSQTTSCQIQASRAVGL